MEETVYTTEPWHPGNICEGKKTLPMSSYEKEKAALGGGGGRKAEHSPENWNNT